MFRKIVLFLLIPVFLASCREYKSQEKQAVRTDITIKSSYMNSPFFLVGSVLEGLINYNTEYISVNESDCPNENDRIKALIDGYAELAIVSGPEAYMAYTGHPAYWDGPQNLCCLFGIFPSVYNGIASMKSQIKDFSDLVGSTIAINTEDSVSGNLFSYFLGLNGINSSNTKIYRVDPQEGLRMLKNGQTDFIWYNMGYGYSGRDKHLVSDIGILSQPVPLYESNKMREFLTVYPVFFTDPIESPLVERSENGERPRIFESSTFLACTPDMSDEMAYTISKTWFENIKYINNFFPVYNEKNARVYIKRRIPVPMHPGAEKYLKEAGLLN